MAFMSSRCTRPPRLPALCLGVGSISSFCDRSLFRPSPPRYAAPRRTIFRKTPRQNEACETLAGAVSMASILVTGANRGLGLEFVRQYAAEGWRVFACVRRPDEAKELKEIAAGARDRVRVHPLEVADHSQIEALARELKDEAIDILLNNAGVYGPNKMFLGQIDYKLW